MKYAIWIAWPSFLAAGIAEAAFFTLVDPSSLEVLGSAVTLSRTATYTVGFFGFWGLGAASSALTCFLQRSAVDINRLCPLEPGERPVGCPKRCTG